MRILEDGSTTDHRLGIGEITLPPHTPGRRSTASYDLSSNDPSVDDISEEPRLGVSAEPRLGVIARKVKLSGLPVVGEECTEVRPYPEDRGGFRFRGSIWCTIGP